MNLLVLAVAGWIALGLQVGLRDAFLLGNNDIAPHFTLILITFVSAWARRHHLLWFALVMGVMMDLLTSVPLTTGDTATVIGPHALGYALAAYTAYILRAWMYRRHALAIAFLSAAASLVAAVAAVTLLKARTIYDPLELSPASAELGIKSASALYTGAVAIPAAIMLGWVRPLFRFPSQGRGGMHTGRSSDMR